MKGGGDFYLISRTLGLGFGAAITIVLFLAQSVSIGFYCIGMGEAVISLVPGTNHLEAQAIAAAAVLALITAGSRLYRALANSASYAAFEYPCARWPFHSITGTPSLQPVPPTVNPSILSVGCPTPTGTLCPSLPQVPTPESSSRSLPTMLTRVSTSGPFPISVAPFTG